MLAYVFWHRPAEGVSRGRYEELLRLFHAELDFPAASFRLDRLPFADLDGYEDWYLVENWHDLGRLNAAAIDNRRRDSHGRVAELVGEDWGGVYLLVRGAARAPAEARWLAKLPSEGLGVDASSTVWRRQLVLGPAPQYCLNEGGDEGRERLWEHL